MGWNSATGYALHRIPAHRKKRTINLLQNRTFLFTSDSTIEFKLWILIPHRETLNARYRRRYAGSRIELDAKV